MTKMVNNEQTLSAFYVTLCLGGGYLKRQRKKLSVTASHDRFPWRWHPCLQVLLEWPCLSDEFTTSVAYIIENHKLVLIECLGTIYFECIF